jgi:hypothetical protein
MNERTVHAVGKSTAPDRQLFVVEVPTLADLPSAFELPSVHFVCFLACDATTIQDQVIAIAARRLLSTGGVYFCAWGPGCERLNDVVDTVVLQHLPAEDESNVVMTTWHSDESLDSALWFSVFTAEPADAYAGSCKAMLAIVVGNSNWGERVRGRLSDPERFTSEVLA